MLLLERFDLLEEYTSVFVALEDSEGAKGAVNDALGVANAQESPSDQAPLLAVVGRVQYVQLKDQPLGQATMDEALEIAKSIPDKNKQANVMYDIALDYFKLGQADRACGILSQAKDLVRELSEGKPIFERIEQLQGQKGC
jgi:tetratricopeptide (TPR) repeat protein